MRELTDTKRQEEIFRIGTGKDLVRRLRKDLDIIESAVEGKSTMKFRNLEDAVKFVKDLTHEYLVLKYGLEEAKKIPIDILEPARYRDEAGKEVIRFEGISKSTDDPTWLLVPSDKLDEFRSFYCKMIVERDC